VNIRTVVEHSHIAINSSMLGIKANSRRHIKFLVLSLTLWSRHRKYHIKQHKCLEPSCASRQVTFSLEKDLIRHQAKHNRRRFHCHHTKFRNAFGGAKGGFTRQDNLKRHIAAQHPWVLVYAGLAMAGAM